MAPPRRVRRADEDRSREAALVGRSLPQAIPMAIRTSMTVSTNWLKVDANPISIIDRRVGPRMIASRRRRASGRLAGIAAPGPARHRRWRSWRSFRDP